MRFTTLVALVGSALLGAVGVLSGVSVVNGEQTSSPRHINLPERNIDAPFSDAVLVGHTLYLSGRLGLDPATGKPPAEVEAEVRNILDGMKATLAEAGMTMDDLVWVQVFCADVGLYDQFNAVYRTYFSDAFPARAFLGSGTLLRGANFEVQGVAAR